MKSDLNCCNFLLLLLLLGHLVDDFAFVDCRDCVDCVVGGC